MYLKFVISYEHIKVFLCRRIHVRPLYNLLSGILVYISPPRYKIINRLNTLLSKNIFLANLLSRITTLSSPVQFNDGVKSIKCVFKIFYLKRYPKNACLFS